MAHLRCPRSASLWHDSLTHSDASFRKRASTMSTLSWRYFETAIQQRHGSMLVVARDAEAEAERLGGQGTRIEPTVLTPTLYRRVSDIDGTIIIDPHCVCYAIGVILDGPA